MDMDDFDVYPISHNGRVYNIITAMDMTFREVRGLIDALAAMGAFAAGPDAPEHGELYSPRRRGIRLRGRCPGVRCDGLPPRAGVTHHWTKAPVTRRSQFP